MDVRLIPLVKSINFIFAYFKVGLVMSVLAAGNN